MSNHKLCVHGYRNCCCSYESPDSKGESELKNQLPITVTEECLGDIIWVLVGRIKEKEEHIRYLDSVHIDNKVLRGRITFLERELKKEREEVAELKKERRELEAMVRWHSRKDPFRDVV
jgi:hypothetical protein